MAWGPPASRSPINRRPPTKPFQTIAGPLAKSHPDYCMVYVKKRADENKIVLKGAAYTQIELHRTEINRKLYEHYFAFIS